MVESEKERKKTSAKYKWEIPHIIPIMPIVGFNHCLNKLHLSKIMVQIYTTGKTINFSVGYMINPSLNFNNVFRKKVENAWVILFLLGK